MTASKSRRTQRRRLHRARGGWNPIEHNAAVAARKLYARIVEQRREKTRARRAALHNLAIAATNASTAMRAAGVAMAAAQESIAKAIAAGRTRMHHINELHQYGINAGLDDDDIHTIITRGLQAAHTADTEPDWTAIRNQLDGQYIREALLGGQ